MYFFTVVEGKINFDDLDWKKRPYSALGAYNQSKLANVLFTKELARRLGGKFLTNRPKYDLNIIKYVL